MEKWLFLFATIVVLVFTSCENTGKSTLDQASSKGNYDCSFVLQTPVGYDQRLGVGLSGNVFITKDHPSTATLWLSKDLYNNLIKDQNGQNIKLYKGRCAESKIKENGMFTFGRGYFVYFVE